VVDEILQQGSNGGGTRDTDLEELVMGVAGEALPPNPLDLIPTLSLVKCTA
jgi:hypothetical protein